MKWWKNILVFCANTAPHDENDDFDYYAGAK